MQYPTWTAMVAFNLTPVHTVHDNIFNKSHQALEIPRLSPPMEKLDVEIQNLQLWTQAGEPEVDELVSLNKLI